ncbi:MAG: XshC-Cox1 family protein [Cyanobacteria bacterium K_DeepCast_35m_m2_023]|nr:XshC-Cox1 family protein [Cyanobacteria bacterium K_DeepCast_35m_m2_023]
MDFAKSAEEKLFALMMLGDDRAIQRTDVYAAQPRGWPGPQNDPIRCRQHCRISLMASMPLWQELLEAVQAGETVALATVVQIEGSTPRPPGASLLLRQGGAVVGAVSGGCVEADLLDAATAVITSGQPQRRRYGAVDSDDPFSIGLTCGGSLDVVIEAIGAASGRGATEIDQESTASVLAALASAIAQDQTALLVSRFDGQAGLRLLTSMGTTAGCLGCASLNARADVLWTRLQANNQPASTKAGTTPEWPSEAWLDPGEQPAQVPLVLRLHRPRPAFWIIGAIDSSAALAQLARQLGYRVTIVDAREPFATERRFPMADAVVCEWPDTWMEQQTIHPDTVIAVLTHDPKFDIPTLCLALRSPAAYVGAMGSRRTNADRLERLQQAGLKAAEIRRLRAPIGLDLGGRSAEEMALAILAEVVMLRQGGSGQPLCDSLGPIHHH